MGNIWWGNSGIRGVADSSAESESESKSKEGRTKRNSARNSVLSSSSVISTTKNLKLEEQNHNKGLSLDPHRNHHHHHQNYCQFQHQNQNPRNVDEQEREEDQQQQQQQQQPPFSAAQSQEPQQQQQLPFNYQLYLQQSQSGYQFKDLYSQLEHQNLVPISESQQPIKKRSYLSSSSAPTAVSAQHVRQKASMENSSVQQQQQQQPQQQPVSARSALRKAGVGEIVEVQGGHIVRATGRKDRHSKVCTAKGPRDRRVRLSAHTAIQFYDVQDRLGYDRPSKAVDWLIKKAKASIDELGQLPAWSPSNMNVSSSNRRRGKNTAGYGVVELAEDKAAGSAEGMYDGGEEQQHLYSNANNSGLLPPSLDSDAIADTIKSFFPMARGNVGPTNTSSASASPMQFQDYSQGGGLLQRSGGDGAGSSSSRQTQDLKLSLQSFQDPIMMHQQHSHHHHGATAAHAHAQDEQQHSLFPGAVPIGFENPNSGWADNQHQHNPEMGRLHRLVVGWNTQHSGAEHHGVGANGGGGYVFNQPPPLLQPLFGGSQHNQFLTQRGPLQSSNTPSIRAWISDPSFSVASSNEHHNHHYHQAIAVHPQAFSGLGFTPGGFSGFHIPARIQGEEEHDGDPNRPSSASSGSRH